jgi:CO/xanthine dehydrogenase Mo-binding subunit
MNSRMISPTRLEFPEPERYELSEPPKYRFEVNRREFVQILGAGILVSVVAPGWAQRAGSGEPSLQDRLHIAEDGTITVFTSKVECGQGSRTELTQATAEELCVPINQVRLIMADSAVGPNDGGTAGSRTTPSTVPSVRKGCAAARQLLVETAAKEFASEIASLKVEDGKVVGLPSGKTFGYAELAKRGEPLKRDSQGVNVRTVSEWRVLGTGVPKVDAEAIVTGKHRYPSDIVRPGMLYGKVLRPSAFGAELQKVDLEAGRKVDGAVVVRDGNFVGVVAANTFAAEKARAALEKTAGWKTGSQTSSEELFDYLKSNGRGGRRELKGAPDDLLKSGPKLLKAEYQVAYIQHAPMEPRVAVAEWEGDKLTVWTGTQQPQRVREELARSFQISPERVRVIVPDMGGGFGGKHSGECAVEAARLAQPARKPVKLRWTREEEFAWAYFRPAGVITISAALDDANAISAWEHINYNSGASSIGTPYEIPNVATEFRNCDNPPLRAGSYRALAATANAFARESMMDELADIAGLDPLEFRLKQLKNERMRAVLTAAAEKFRWDERWKKNNQPQARGVGVACSTEKGSYVACCVEVEIFDGGGYRVGEVAEAFECGAILNPRNTLAQVEGAIIQGLGGALREEIKFANGKMLNGHFSEYLVPRFADVPKIECVLVDRKDLASVGAGETPIIAVAPAIANAIANATQIRIRSMPIRNQQIKPA